MKLLGAIIFRQKTNRKRLIAGPVLSASLAILDPNFAFFTLSLPPNLTEQTGIDALSHTIETYAETNYNPVAEALSLKAASIIFNHCSKFH